MSTTTQTTSSFPLLGVLGVAFVVLKLTGVIAWSWLWVLAPFWAPLALFLVFALVVLIVVALKR